MTAIPPEAINAAAEALQNSLLQRHPSEWTAEYLRDRARDALEAAVPFCEECATGAIVRGGTP